MSVPTSLRRKAIAFPVALVVALGAAGFAAGPAAASDQSVIDDIAVVDDARASDAADAALPGEPAPSGASAEPARNDGDAAEPEPEPDAVPEPDTEVEAVPEPGTGEEIEPGTGEAPATGTEVEPGTGEEIEPGTEVEPEPGTGEAPPPGAEAIPFTVLSPAPDDTTLTRTVLFAGTGADGATVTLTDEQGEPLPGVPPVTVTGGAWTTTAVYADDADNAQTVTITLAADGAEPEVQTVTFALPDPGAEVPFEVLTPMPGEVLPTRTVVFTGTGDEGAVVTVLGSDAQPLPGTQPVTVVAGLWLVTATYADDAPVAQTATVALSVDGGTPETQTVSFELPSVAALPAPAITSPAPGEVVTGTQVTFRGTGEPGAFIGLVVVPTALAQDALADSADPDADGETSLSAVEPTAAPAPADPADPIVVAADGTWSVTVALAPEDYTVVAVQASDAAGTTGLSDPSTPVAFSLRAAPVAVPALVSTGSDTPSRTLAATGGDDITGLLGISILVMLAGAAAVVTNRRRSARTSPQ